MRVGSLSDVGKVRTNNEDAYGLEEDRGVFVVADGMGGHQAGEVASWRAIEVILSELRYRAPTEDAAAALRRAIAQANSQIEDSARRDQALKGMGTTVVAALVGEESFTVAHVGDSRAYLIRDGSIRQLTEDHSMVVELIRAGVISPQQAATHPYRSAISRSLGQFKEVESDTLEVEWLTGDRLLLCTDGLSRFVSDKEVLETVLAFDDPQDACRRLVDLALVQGGRDNVTVLLVANLPVPG